MAATIAGLSQLSMNGDHKLSRLNLKPTLSWGDLLFYAAVHMFLSECKCNVSLITALFRTHRFSRWLVLSRHGVTGSHKASCPIQSTGLPPLANYYIQSYKARKYIFMHMFVQFQPICNIQKLFFVLLSNTYENFLPRDNPNQQFLMNKHGLQSLDEILYMPISHILWKYIF
jgi:hypothetical protein